MADRDPNTGSRTSARMMIGLAIMLVVALTVVGILLTQLHPKTGDVSAQESAHGPLEPAH